MEEPKIKLNDQELAELRRHIANDTPMELALGLAQSAETHLATLVMAASVISKAQGGSNKEQSEAHAMSAGMEILNIGASYLAELLRMSNVPYDKLIKIAAMGIAHAGVVRAGMKINLGVISDDLSGGKAL